MKSYLGLLAGLAIRVLADTCDPNAYEESNPYNLEETTDPKVTSKLLEYLADSACHMYSDGTEQDVKEQCKNVCIPGDSAGEGQVVVSSQSCIFGDNPWYGLTDTLHPLLCGAERAYNGLMIKSGYCSCDLPILEFAGEFFINGLIEAGKILEKVICPALKALDVVVAIGMAAIPPPGRAITGGMVAAVRSAKAYKYAHEAQDAAQEWADFFLSGLNFAEQAGCGPLIPSRSDLIKKAFTPLVDAPDEIVPGGMDYDGLPCPKKGCKGCKGPNCTNNSGNGDGDTSKASGKPTSTTQSYHSSSKVPPANSTVSSKTSSTPAPSSATASQPSSSISPGNPTITSTTLIPSTLSLSSSTATSCEALAALDDDDDVPEVDLFSRSYPIDLRYRGLEKRAKAKSGMACEYLLSSFRYPGSGEWGDNPPKRYGFNKRDSCDDYSWDSPDDGAKVKYESEHVLEWQTVVQFFVAMGQEITAMFKHPNPDEDTMLNFCQYWKESWTEEGVLIAGPPASPAATPDPHASPNPPDTPDSVATPSPNATPSPTDTPDSAATPNPDITPSPTDTPDPTATQDSPVAWLASVYPYRKRGGEKWLEEMPLLEKQINGNYKGQLFTQTKTNAGNDRQIVDKDDMKALIEGRTTEQRYASLNVNEQSRVAIRKLRPMIGALKYMQEDNIAKIFANQKNRIGAMIGHIDRELHKTPRKYDSGTGAVDAHPWQEQGLEDRWNVYMDSVFAVAKRRATEFMDLHLDSLEAEWKSPKKTNEFKDDVKDIQATKDKKRKLKETQENMLALIEKTEDEWKKVKDWKKPQNWEAKSEKDTEDDGSNQKDQGEKEQG